MRGVLLGTALACLAAAPARADVCMLDMWDNGATVPGQVFPNWSKVRAASFDVLLCLASDCTWVATEVLTAITVVNFGSASSGDLKAVFVQVKCDVATTGLLPMTYAGMYTSDSGLHPAWTWAGTTPNLAGCADLCGKTACGAAFTIDVYADIAACPTDGATVTLGFPTTGQINSWTSWGSIVDNANCPLPQYDAIGAEKTIVYAVKLGTPQVVAPGDTVTYTIFYGRPGTAALTGVEILDTLPPYTHYVSGSGVPAADVGWDPDFGPPPRLRWTVPGPLAVTGGPTGEVRFSLSVDWGNGETFEPGSGDTAAPEGARLLNTAQVTFGGTTCAPGSRITQPADTVVRRFLMWMLGDNDILFAASPGQPADEIIYSVFIKNVSTTRTWWNVSLWDTVPAELDVWSPGFGLEDGCVGWSMTPSGCAAASAGVAVSGPNTILTWRLDMPPQTTLSVRWKAATRPTAPVGSTAVNILSAVARGRPGISGGSGHSGPPARFAHLAPIILATTYVSYSGYACGQSSCDSSIYFIPFFPLNRKTQFELRAIYYNGGWANTGGLSDPLGCLVGNCISGFPGGACGFGSGAIAGGGVAGCKAERIPARFDAQAYSFSTPIHHIYKVVSNSPFAWEVLVGDPLLGIANCGENIMYAPATTLSHTGLMHYMYRRKSAQNDTMGERLIMMNTTLDPYGNPSADLPTTVHLFKFDYALLDWTYMRTFEIDHESVASDFTTTTAELGPWRTVSSIGQLIINQSASSAYCNADGGCNCHNPASYMPTRETGNLVSRVGVGTFYGIPENWNNTDKVYVSNVGANAVYDIWRYIPIGFAGTSGRYVQMAVNLALPGGLAAPLNPAIFGIDGPYFNTTATTAYKIELKSGGPIQVLAGARVFSAWASGGSMHATNGDQTGVEFWMPHGPSDASASCPTTHVQTVDIFCPKSGMAVRAISEDGYSATYTTTAADQCISFMNFTDPARKRNYRFNVLPGPSSGKVLAQYFMCGWERSYTAPFLSTGTHYVIIAPPTVYIGQSFWITILVVDSSGSTKNDYCGTSSFTSTDPGAKLEGGPMDTYNFTWSSSVSCNAAPNEDGVKLFMNVSMTRLGLQTLVASDTTDGSIMGLTAILVVGADVKLSKTPRLVVGASGDTVQFQVCWSNYSSASAFTFVITDAVPVGTTFLPEAGTAAFNCGNTKGVAPITAYSTTASTSPPGTFTEANPLAGTRWLRWTIPQAGVNTTGCICFRVTVN